MWIVTKTFDFLILVVISIDLYCVVYVRACVCVVVCVRALCVVYKIYTDVCC